MSRYASRSQLALRTHQLLRTFEETEGLVYWAGVQDGHGGTVTTLIVPRADRIL